MRDEQGQNRLKSSVLPDKAGVNANRGQGVGSNFVTGILCELEWEFCTCVHRFAQKFEENLIDGAHRKIYFAHQIEPGS